MRSADQIKKAHDLLTAIIRKVPIADAQQRGKIEAAASVLCWVLEHHHHDDKFGKYLEQLERIGVDQS